MSIQYENQKHLYHISDFDGGKFDDDKSVCVFAAPAVFLHMMRCLLNGERDDTPIDESK
jgi:hypothetical protein